MNKTNVKKIEALQPTKKGKQICTQSWISIRFEVILLIFVALSFVQILFVPKQLNKQIENNVEGTVVMSVSQQKANNNKYQDWERNASEVIIFLFFLKSESGVQLFNFYVYNITNPYEVLNGSIPQLQEIGPYIYRRFEFKSDVVFSEDSCTVSYRYDFSFEYQADMTNSQNSVGINETVTILNPEMLTFFNTMNTGFALTAWAQHFSSLPAIKLFYQVPIQDVILGVTDPGLAKLIFKPV
ncbi:lysosomal integral membrane glycoprotein, partial [Reticulomyxa filosa]